MWYESIRLSGFEGVITERMEDKIKLCPVSWRMCETLSMMQILKATTYDIFLKHLKTSKCSRLCLGFPCKSFSACVDDGKDK